MEELKRLTDQEVHLRMLDTSQRERELTVQMISLVEEAGRRRFYLDFGYSSLFDYLTLGLKYSAGAAMRRLSSARIASEIPEVKERLMDGSLSLSNLSQAEQFFRSEEKHGHVLSGEQKREVLGQIEGHSARVAEKILMRFSSAPEKFKNKDKVKSVSAKLTQISFTADEEFMKELEEARGLLAHKMPHATISEIIAEVMKFGIEGLRKQKFGVKKGEEKSEMKNGERNEQKSGEKAEGRSETKNGEGSEEMHEKLEPVVTSDVGNGSSYIPVEVRREIYERDQGMCVVVNQVTGKVCGSQRGLEWDHYPVARAMGGASVVSNLRLACRGCNILHAVKTYGREKVVAKMAVG